MFCYSCGKEISNEAVTCPHCGATQDKNENEPTSFVIVTKSYKKPVLGLVLTCLASLLLIISCVIRLISAS